MNYLRTFFEKPLKQHAGKADLVALDFGAIIAVGSNREIRFRGGNDFAWIKEESWSDFLVVFEEYCRDMQSLERTPVRMPTTAVEMPKQVGGQITISDPKADQLKQP